MKCCTSPLCCAAVTGRYILLLCVWVALLCCGSSDAPLDAGGEDASTGARAQMKAPDFTLTALDGTSFSLHTQANRPVFLNFWATWCGPCVAEMPDMQQLQNKMGDQIAIVGINLGESPEVVRQFVQVNGYSWLFLTDTRSAVGNLYAVSAIPTSIFVNARGTIVARRTGTLTRSDMERLARETIASTQ